MNVPLPRLTALAHGGGCGCKLSPAVLRELLADEPLAMSFPALLVGTETGDDAAVWQIDDDTCIVATTDFFMPMVDDPFDFGRIAATNALSDIYAMGGRPIFALAVLGMPIDRLPATAIREILRGGRAIAEEAGISIVGGHSIDAPEPIYGLAAIGLVSPKAVRRNSGATPGDTLILTKPLGVGIYSAAIKKDELSAAEYSEMIGVMTQLNRIGADLARKEAVHGITDVTGFGLLGHVLEMARGAGLRIRLSLASLPLLFCAERFAKAGVATGASGRNWASYGEAVSLPDSLPLWQRNLLTDPQTSGGLLIAVESGEAIAILAEIQTAGFPQASIIGRTEAGPPGIVVDG